MTPRGRSLLAATTRIREAGCIVPLHPDTDNHRRAFCGPEDLFCGFRTTGETGFVGPSRGLAF
jgi:hypothetical protein